MSAHTPPGQCSTAPFAARVAELGSITHFSRTELISEESNTLRACNREAAAPGATLLMWPDVKAPRPAYQLSNRDGICS